MNKHYILYIRGERYKKDIYIYEKEYIYTHICMCVYIYIFFLIYALSLIYIYKRKYVYIYKRNICICTCIYYSYISIYFERIAGKMRSKISIFMHIYAHSNVSPYVAPIDTDLCLYL